MRERFLEAFDTIRIDNASTATSTRPVRRHRTGRPDPSIFSTPDNPVGIQIGTAIATLVRKSDHAQTKAIGFRHLWGQTKREKLRAETAANGVGRDL